MDTRDRHWDSDFSGIYKHDSVRALAVELCHRTRDTYEVDTVPASATGSKGTLFLRRCDRYTGAVRKHTAVPYELPESPAMLKARIREVFRLEDRINE